MKPLTLRERKKKETRHSILSASKNVFLTKGYAQTTIDEIAEKANVGVGTVYNYFQSKADIFITIMSDELVLDETDIPMSLVGHLKPNSVIDCVLTLVSRYLQVIKLVQKEVWQELLGAATSNPKSEKTLLDGMFQMDDRFIDKTEAMFQQLKKEQLLHHSFAEKEAAYAVYSVVLTQFIFYIYRSECTTEELYERIKSQIYFIFDGKYTEI